MRSVRVHVNSRFTSSHPPQLLLVERREVSRKLLVLSSGRNVIWVGRRDTEKRYSFVITQSLSEVPGKLL